MPTTPTYIDNQTLAGVVIALDFGNPSKWSSWVVETALISTALLISVDDIRVSPTAQSQNAAVGAYVGVAGHYETIGKSLIGTIRHYKPEKDITLQAAKTVSKWAHQNQTTIQCAHDLLIKDNNYGSWIDYEIKNGWTTASIILNGLVEENFISPIAAAANIPLDNAKFVLKQSRDIKKIIEWSRANYRGEDKKIAEILFSMGALIRGRYHDRVAQLFGSSIMHHPLRENLLKRLPTRGAKTYHGTNCLEYLSKIVIASALTQSKTSDKIVVWADNISTLRKAIIHSKTINLPEDDIATDHALRLAIRIAQDCNIQTHSKIIDLVIEHSLGLGLGAGSSFLLSPWAFAPVYVGTIAAQKTVQKNLIPKQIFRSEWRLSHLASSIPGRLKRT